MTGRCRRVGAESVLRVHEPLRLMLQVAVSGVAPARVEETLQVSCDGRALDVIEVERWRAVDATLRAPRASLVRIATGRDAADPAFLSAYGGAADLLWTDITAVVDGHLPRDDVAALVNIA